MPSYERSGRHAGATRLRSRSRRVLFCLQCQGESVVQFKRYACSPNAIGRTFRRDETAGEGKSDTARASCGAAFCQQRPVHHGVGPVLNQVLLVPCEQRFKLGNTEAIVAGVASHYTDPPTCSKMHSPGNWSDEHHANVSLAAAARGRTMCSTRLS